MYRNSFKTRMKYIILFQGLGMCFVFLKSSTPTYLKIIAIFTLIGSWETVPLGFQLQSQYQMSKSLVNNSPIYCPPLKEVVRG